MRRAAALVLVVGLIGCAAEPREPAGSDAPAPTVERSPVSAKPVQAAGSSRAVVRRRVDLRHEGSTLGAVLDDVARQAPGFELYVTDRSLLDRPLSVTLLDIPWEEAVAVVVCRMATLTCFLDVEQRLVFVDYACTRGLTSPSRTDLPCPALAGLTLP